MGKPTDAPTAGGSGSSKVDGRRKKRFSKSVQVGNYAKFLKNLHSEQLHKLQLKNQHECDLLEDIRQFTIKRSAIEKSYSEALLKISAAYLNKKSPNIPDIKVDGAEEKWNMWSVWRTVLEENEKLARARLAAIEVFQQQIADEAKVLRDYKLQIARKCVNQLGVVQKEVQLSVVEVDKTKKSYFDEEHTAHDVRDKARDIEEKLKKKKGSFFQSITSLQKNSARVTSRKEQMEEKSSGARNDYLLGLASANAHQNRYFTVDLQTTMSSMENYVYERIADYLTLMGRTELLTCSATQNSFSRIRDQAQQLTREYNLQCCYLFYPALKQHIQYDFEPCDNDPVNKITTEHESAAATLSKEAQRLAQKIVRNNNCVRESARKLGIYASLRDAGQRVDPNDQNGPDLETKMEDLREAIRKSETEKVKSEACLECLRAGGINVDEWLQEAEIMGVHEIPRSNSSLSMRTDASGQGENPSSDSFYDSDNAEQETQPQTSTHLQQKQQQQQPPPQAQPVIDSDDSDLESVGQDAEVDAMLEQERQKIEQLTAGWDDPTQVDWGAEEAAAAASSAAATAATSAAAISPSASNEPIFKCTALYSYTAQNPDELTIVENEQLEVVGEGDGDGWLRARNYRGQEGYVPHNYLDVERDVPQDSGTSSQLQSQISFSSVDYTVDNDDQETYQSSVQSPDQVSVISAPAKTAPTLIEYCIALYDYDASAEDELTFEEGQIIKIITKSAHGVDDGWWEGEVDGKVGNFPSLVVEECDEAGEPLTDAEDESPPPSAPPLFTPPGAPPLPPAEYFAELDGQHIINGPNSTQSITEAQISEKFAMGLTRNQKTHYDTQFSETEVMITEELEDSEEEVGSEPPKMAPPKLPSAEPSQSQDNFGLGVAQIIVTAATPMREEPDKDFPIINEEEEEEEEENVPAELEQEISVAVPIVIAKKEPEQVKSIPSQKQTDMFDEEDDFADFPADKLEEKPSEPSSKRPHDPPPPPPPTVVQKAPAEPAKVMPAEEPAAFEANFEANFDANFDEAFGSEPEAEPPCKQVVAGRASIPDELAPHQLARLQNLKESNA